MPTVEPFPAGGYRFIAHQFQYSGGVAAEPGFRIEHARFARPLPLAEGFDAIEAYLAGIGRSPTAFCACELRSPAQFTDAGFIVPTAWAPSFGGEPGTPGGQQPSCFRIKTRSSSLSAASRFLVADRGVEAQILGHRLVRVEADLAIAPPD
jgi:hypothetical protein